MDKVVGIDVSKDKLDVVLLNEHKQQRYVQVVNNEQGWSALSKWLRQQAAAGCRVCLEATGRYSEGVAQALYEAGYVVHVVNPARVRGYATSQLRRNKTDKLDAALLADFCRSQELEAWRPAPPEVRHLQALVRHLAALEAAKQQCANRLRDQAALPTLVVEQLQHQLTLLMTQIEQLKQAIQDHIEQFPDLKRQRDLMASIKGIGLLTAAKLLAECRPLTDFEDVRQLVAFAGLNPAHHQSGSSIRKKTVISKCGNSAIRAALYMPAISAKNHNPLVRAFAERLRAKGLCEMAIIAAVMRKLLHLVFGVLKSGKSFDPNFALAA
jgi:transposase